MNNQQFYSRQAQPVMMVAGREIRTRFQSKAFRILTVILLVIIVAFAIVMKFVGGNVGTDSVGVVSNSPAFAAQVKASANVVDQQVDTSTISDVDQGKSQVSQGKLDALVVDNNGTLQVFVKKNIDPKLESGLNYLAQQRELAKQIRQLGGNPAKVADAAAANKIQITSLQPAHQYNSQQLVLGIITGILIYISLMINGQQIAQGVVEEKSSRVVELLLSTIRPWQLMAGKVLGLGLVGLVQIIVIGGVGLAVGLSLGVLTISATAALGTIIWLVVWYLLGFFAYAIVFAALGALVSRQEEVGSAVMPALMFVVAGYIIGISILPSNPGSTLCEVLSIIPMFAPTMMPMRLAMGGVPGWEAALSVLLMVALIPALLWLSARIYRNSVMRTGARVKFSQALKPV